MNKPDWARIKADYVETAATLVEVQEKWGIPRGTLSARASREKWNDAKQHFAANLEHLRREQNLAKRAAEREQFENNVLKIATGQLGVIVRQMQDGQVDAAKVLKLASALEKVQRIGCAAYGK
jgi:chromatin segregation and condensation protein Rec8/ScpA/Scc1 (kleisin family)